MPKINPNDYINKKYGKLTVLEVFPGNWKIKPQIKAKARCLCECGKEKIVQFDHMKSGNTSSCGCLRYSQVMVGDRFGRLIVEDIILHHYKDGKRIESRFKCRCDCGVKTEGYVHNLLNKSTVSCGCYAREKAREMNLSHGLSKNPLYFIWHGINNRCTNKNLDSWENYGGRGISNFWKSDPKGFIEYIEKGLGAKPTLKHSLDRIDNNGNYEPGNLRWATAKEQAQNKTHAYQRKIEDLEKRIAELELKYCIRI